MWILIYAWIQSQNNIYNHIFKKNHTTVIGLDVEKGLRDDMIVNDMNSCIVISDRLNVRGVGNNLQGWMR